MLPTRMDAQALPPPPGIIGSLRAGFDAIAAHIGLILLPLGLDLLLWLGPRVGISKLMQPVLDEMARLAPTAGLAQADINAMLAMYRELLGRLNLLSALRTFPVGLSSLMIGRMPGGVPFGTPTILQVDTAAQLLGLFLIMTLLGWMLGGLYFYRVAGLVASKPLVAAPPTAARAVTQTILYSLIWAILLWSLGLPGLFIIYLAFAINTLLGQILVLFLGFVSLWLLVPLFFSPHGIYLRKQNAFASFLSGFQLTRFTLPSSSLFVLAVFLLGMGLNLLWSVPAEDSWLALVGILGHAFITTALLASSFIYYQDMSAWVQTVLARLRAGMPTQQA
ncbi:MAG: hypothetical protein V1755_11430 [Chloroflexota bacterium]